MRLKEIIDILVQGDQAVLYEKIHPYRRSIRIYFKSYYNSTPILIPVMVSNAVQYCLVAPEGEVSDAIVQYDSEAGEYRWLFESYTQYMQIL